MKEKISIKMKLQKLWPNISEIVSLILLALLIWAIGYSLFNEAVGLKSQMLSLAVCIEHKLNSMH